MILYITFYSKKLKSGHYTRMYMMRLLLLKKMSSLECIPPEAGIGTTSEAPDPSKREFFVKGRWLCPRRYVIALMLFLLLLMKHWRALNIEIMILGALDSDDEDIAIGHWSFYDLRNFYTANEVVSLLAQMPGALLIFKIASHKFLLLSAVATSILHMLTPVVLRHHSITLLLAVFSQAALQAPVLVAVMSMWKNWAPPLERTKLMIFSASGIFIAYGVGRLMEGVLRAVSSSFYLVGVVGLVWSFFWYNLISDAPQNDPLISESEFLYLECSIAPEDKEKRSLKDIPWKSILTSRPIAILCPFFLKMSISRAAVLWGNYYFMDSIPPNDLSYQIPIFLSFVFVIICSAVLADFLIKRFSGRTLLIRKYFLCGGFILQTCFLCGIFASSAVVKATFYVLAYIMYAASFPGFFTIALDLSPRYVAITSGILYSFFSIGYLCTYLVQRFHHDFEVLTWGLLICDGILGLVCAGLFYKWGDVQEQLWSLASISRGTRPRCSGLYPNTEHQDDDNLMPGNA